MSQRYTTIHIVLTTAALLTVINHIDAYCLHRAISKKKNRCRNLYANNTMYILKYDGAPVSLSHTHTHIQSLFILLLCYFPFLSLHWTCYLQESLCSVVKGWQCNWVQLIFGTTVPHWLDKALSVGTFIFFYLKPRGIQNTTGVNCLGCLGIRCFISPHSVSSLYWSGTAETKAALYV